MTERDIQNAVHDWQYQKTHSPIMIPNVSLSMGWEADLLLVSAAGYGVEFEIKRTISDLRADVKKWKHKYLSGWLDANYGLPSQFYYVCQDGLFGVADIPEHAGLIYVCVKTHSTTYDWEVSPETMCVVIKKAPRLRAVKFSDDEIYRIMKQGIKRYWTAQRVLSVAE